MGKFKDKSGGTTPTRVINPAKTRRIQSDAASVETEVILERDQLAALGELEKGAPPTIASAGAGAPKPPDKDSGKTVVYLEPLAVLLSQKSRRPVKMMMSREEVFRATGPTSGTHCK